MASTASLPSSAPPSPGERKRKPGVRAEQRKVGCVSCIRVVCGRASPNPADAGQRFTSLSNGFSKELINLKAAIALCFAYYNSSQVHTTLRVSRGMEPAGTDHVWGLEGFL
jgi:hypothetical protein